MIWRSGFSGRRGVLRWFTSVGLAVVAAGATLAIYADRAPSEDLRFASAARDIGAALVAGGIIAVGVGWFDLLRDQELSRAEDARAQRRFEAEQERDQLRFQKELEREAKRFELEQERESRVAARAWRRAVGIRLITLVDIDLAEEREQLRSALLQYASEPAAGTRSALYLRPLDAALQKIEATKASIRGHAELLRDDALLDAWRSWSVSATRSWTTSGDSGDVIGSDRGPVDLRDVSRWLDEERREWLELRAAVVGYREREFP